MVVQFALSDVCSAVQKNLTAVVEINQWAFDSVSFYRLFPHLFS